LTWIKAQLQVVAHLGDITSLLDLARTLGSGLLFRALPASLAICAQRA
jgi:hypothetical protein